MLLRDILFEELSCTISEADIRNIPKHFKGYKAFEIAYNRLLMKGVLRGKALPLEFSTNTSIPLNTVKLLKRKNAYELAVNGNSNSPVDDKAFTNTDAHDLIHLLTVSMAEHFASHAQGQQNKFAAKKRNNSTILKAAQAFQTKFGYNPFDRLAKVYAKNLVGSLQNNTFQQDAAAAQKELNNSVKSKEDFKIVPFLRTALILDKQERAHYQKPLTIVGISDIGAINYEEPVTSLPQYDIEEDIGNVVAFFGRAGSLSLTPLLANIKNGVPISNNEEKQVVDNIQNVIGKENTRAYARVNQPIDVTEKLAEFKKYLLTIVPLFVSEYNKAIGLLT